MLGNSFILKEQSLMHAIHTHLELEQMEDAHIHVHLEKMLGTNIKLLNITLLQLLNQSKQKFTPMDQSKQDFWYILTLCLTKVVFMYIQEENLKVVMLSKLLAGDLKEVWIIGLLLTLGDQLGENKVTSESK